MPTLPGILAQVQQARDELAAELKVYDDMLASASKHSKGASTASGTFICPECGKQFAGAGALGSHRSIVHGVKGGSWKAKKTQAAKGQEKGQEKGTEEVKEEGSDQLRIST